MSAASDALKYLSSIRPTDKVRYHYDDDPDFAEAMNVLIPGFEYPDWSHRTVADVLAALGFHEPQH